MYLYHFPNVPSISKIAFEIKNGINGIIQNLTIKEDKIYNIFTYSEIYENALEEELDYTTTLIYNENEEEMYSLSQYILQYNTSNKVIHVAKNNLQIKSQCKNLEDLIEGNTISVNVI